MVLAFSMLWRMPYLRLLIFYSMGVWDCYERVEGFCWGASCVNLEAYTLTYFTYFWGGFTYFYFS